MDLGLSLRSSFNLENSADEGGTRNPEGSIGMGPFWIGLGRAAQGDHIEKQRELELLPFFTAEKQQEYPQPSAEQRFLRRESGSKLQKVSGKEQQNFRQGVRLLDVNTIPVGEAKEEAAAPRVWMNLSSDHRSGSRGGDSHHAPTMRKKLRLSKDQSAHLEATFRNNTTLNPKLKVDLARKLNLGTRQVEVWFQNRRARTKLKQTEVECEYLKRWCERLTEDNRRLQRELKALRASQHLLPTNLSPSTAASTLTTCSSSTVVLASHSASPTTKRGESNSG